MLNRDGQPLNLAFNASLRADRDVDELMGLCKGVLADGAVNVLEAKFLADWFERHRECALEWPANVLYQRLETMLRDGRLDLEEEKELLGVLINLTGGDASCLNAAALTIGLPIDNPAPSISFPSRKFCFTGKFLLGTRSKCLSFIENLGGMSSESVSQDLDFLVLGVVASRDWAHTSFGRKIEKAVAYKKLGHPIAIISEEHFVGALSATPN